MANVIYSLYERRLRSQLGADAPRHVGVILDGNRRWAADQGSTSEAGHRAGAAKIEQVLGWCEEVGVEMVTLWLLSTENLQRPAAELTQLLTIIQDTIEALTERANEQAAEDPANAWQLNYVGSPEVLPAGIQQALLNSREQTQANQGLHVNIAVGYGGRQELVDAVRSLLAEQAQAGGDMAELSQTLTADDIASHLYTRGQPDPDLVIRTSGEQRLSGFLLWQSAHSEYYFCETYWPDFRKVDFLRALRSYQARHRRFGH